MRFSDISEVHAKLIEKINEKIWKYDYTNKRKNFRAFKWYNFGDKMFDTMKKICDKEGVKIVYRANDYSHAPASITIRIPYKKDEAVLLIKKIEASIVQYDESNKPYDTKVDIVVDELHSLIGLEMRDRDGEYLDDLKKSYEKYKKLVAKL